MRNLFKNNSGFSLIETTLAVIILATGLLAGLSMMQSNVIAGVHLERQTVATQLANEKMEIILADNEFKGISYATNSLNYPDEELLGSFTGYTRTVTITEVDASDLETPAVDSGLNKIDVAVQWAECTECKVILSTLIANTE